MLPPKPAGVNGPEFDTPEADRPPCNDDATLSQVVFDITVTEVETEVEPNRVGDYIWQKSVALVGIHGPILPITAR